MRYHVEITLPVVIDAVDEEAARHAADGLAHHLLDLAELDGDVSRSEDPADKPTVSRDIQALDDGPDTQNPTGFQPGDRVSWTVDTAAAVTAAVTSELTGTITGILRGVGLQRGRMFAQIAPGGNQYAQRTVLPLHLLTRLDAPEAGSR